MKIFLDTGNLDEIREAVSWGIVDGVTTNPSLVAKEGMDHRTLIKEITSMVSGPVSAEAISLEFDGMMREAREFTAWAPNIVVKFPLTIEGLKAVRQCKQEGIKTNVTLCFSANQALLAAKAGATIISPFIGRIDDEGWEGMLLIEEIVTIYANYDYDTEILVASIRHPVHVAQAAKLGAHIGTMPYKVLKQMYHHPLTDIGIEKFLADNRKTQAALAAATK